MKMPQNSIRTWLDRIPVRDAIDRRMASLLQVMLIGFASILVLATVINLFLAPATLSRQSILLNCTVFLLIVSIPFFLLRRGYFRGSVFTIIAVFVGLETYAIFLSDLRLIAETLSLFTLAILLAGLLIGRKALTITFAISVAAVLFGVFKQQDLELKLDGIAIAGNFILVNGLMSMFLGRFDLILRTALKDALEREKDLKNEIAIRNRIQAELEKSIAQLETNNAELERFTYTVSHDLRNPLVTIKGFLGMLGRDIQDQRPERIQHDMERIASATDKMDALLSELLELSRIGRVANPSEEIDTVKLAQEAIDLLDGKTHASNVKIVVASELPVLYGDRIRLLEVFENLIDNAIKYMGTQVEPMIEIGSRNTAGQSIIFVKDNGLGIEETYHTKIFGLFEKLDPTVEGTGIGLALVKRIVETHGGWAWVESEGLGKGSTFCFTISNEKN